MKLLTPTEIKASKETELAKDLLRTEAVKSALAAITADLDLTEAKFTVALSNQRIRWAKEEQEASERLQLIEVTINTLQRQRDELNIPIEAEAKKAHDLFTQAEIVLDDARKTQHESEQAKQYNGELAVLLQDKLDDMAERETAVELREQKVAIREQAVDAEREQIKQLSSELLSKLQNG